MFRIRIRTGVIVLFAVAFSMAAALADDVNWFTIDGGGVMFSAGGEFTLGATIGQPDAGPPAGPMVGGTFSITGGFWAVGQVCNCAGDLDSNGVKNGRDVQTFAQCMTAPGTGCACADFDSNSVLNGNDIALFIAALLASSSCP